jgi:hypothetical protein
MRPAALSGKDSYSYSRQGEDAPAGWARGGIGRREGLRIPKMALYGRFFRLLAKRGLSLMLLHEMPFLPVLLGCKMANVLLAQKLAQDSTQRSATGASWR